MTQQSFQAGWAAIDQTADPAYYIRFMDTVRKGNDSDPEQYRQLFDLLAPQDAEAILDVGCGTGGAVRAVAPHVGNSGRVVGIDYSATMIAEAQKRTDGLALPIEFRVADAQALPFDDNTFHGCFSNGVFEILPNPRLTLAEMVRITRPGGRLVIATCDIDGSVIDAADRAVTRKLLHFIADAECNGWIGRQLRGYAHELGLVDDKVVTDSWLITDFPLAYDLWFRHLVARAQAAGILTAAEATAWVADQEARQQAGRSFLCWSLFTLVARKP